ncbi:MAG: D,D-dipeptide ABC transporter permease, partial [Acidimicrobiia bacterium]
MLDTAQQRLPIPAAGPVAVRLRRFGEVGREVLRNPTTLVGLVIIVALLGMALLAPLLTVPNTPHAYQMPRDWGALNEPPGTPGHPLGTTATGGDVLYGVLWGARTSLR